MKKHPAPTPAVWMSISIFLFRILFSWKGLDWSVFFFCLCVSFLHIPSLVSFNEHLERSHLGDREYLPQCPPFLRQQTQMPGYTTLIILICNLANLNGCIYQWWLFAWLATSEDVFKQKLNVCLAFFSVLSYTALTLKMALYCCKCLNIL